MFRTITCAAAMVFAAPAFAQQPLTPEQEDAMYCVYDALAANNEADAVAEIYFDTNRTPEEATAMRGVIDKRTDVCAAKYGWDKNIEEMAWLIGLHNTLIDILVEIIDLSEAEEGLLVDMLEDLPDEDIKIFFEGEWTKNDAFIKRVSDKLKAANYSKDAQDLLNAMLFMDSNVVLGTAQNEWIRLQKK
jgi:hypothetical protein